MELFEVLLVDPMTNALIVVSDIFFDSFGLAIIVFTIAIRVLTYPLTRKQLRASRAMVAIQPRAQEIQKKYSDPKRRSEEMMKLYKEVGVNPMGCIWPMLVQFPIWIALYNTIRNSLGSTPESFIDLSQRLYPWPFIRQAIPLENHFLWMDLAEPDKLLLLPILVGASTWLQQRMMTPPTTDPRQQQTQQMMMWMMPLMFAYFSLSFPSGLGLYWTATNLIGIILQFSYTRPAGGNWRQALFPSMAAAVQNTQGQDQTGAPDREPAIVASGDSRSRKRRADGRRRRKR